MTTPALRSGASVSIVTPWRDHPELIPAYEAAVKGAEVVIVDTGSTPENRRLVLDMVGRLRPYGWHSDRPGPFSFAAACNSGFCAATKDIVMFLNNDIAAEPGWLDQVERDVRANPNALLGPAVDVRGLAGRAMVYVEGWCIAARIGTWRALANLQNDQYNDPKATLPLPPPGPWDAFTFTRPYWEDVDLSWRASENGIRLRRRPWPVRHLSNVTSDSVPGAKDGSDANRDALDARIAAWDSAHGVPRI